MGVRMLSDGKQKHARPERGPIDPGPALDAAERNLTARGGGDLPRVWLFAVGSAILGGMLGWIVGDEMAHRLPWTKPAQAAMENGEVRREARVLRDLHIEAETRTAVIGMGCLGGILGLMLGVGGGLSRRSNPRAALGGGIGLFLGAAVGAAVPWVLVPVFYSSLKQSPNLAFPLIIHICMYSAVGSVAGLALGISLRGWAGAMNGLVAGAMGAGMGSMVFNLVHTIAFPLEWDFSPMPGLCGSRLLAHLCVAFLSVICVAGVVAGDPESSQHPEIPAQPIDG